MSDTLDFLSKWLTSDDDTLEAVELRDEDKQLQEDFETAVSTNSLKAKALCASIKYGSNCGYFGSNAYILNHLKDKRVRVTIEVQYRGSDRFGRPIFSSIQRVRTLAAGQKHILGCTSGSGPFDGKRSFLLVGCQVLDN